jgi:hypothetical protein
LTVAGCGVWRETKAEQNLQVLCIRNIQHLHGFSYIGIRLPEVCERVFEALLNLLNLR